ncbi:MAG: MBL fold metallo-hydrolase [Christensenellaceae bacterium]|nr:MBL fold metallo-hydrolase [Christensenellaceae bacterium]
MKLTVLGNQGPFAAPGGACSSYLLSHEGQYAVLDMGNGSLANLQKHIGLHEIGAIVLSHLHYDHISDLFVLKYALAQLKAKDPTLVLPELYMPASPAPVAGLLAGDGLKGVHTLKEGETWDVIGLTMSAHAMTHPVESYALCFTGGGKKLVYSGDTNVNEKLAPLAAGADLFLVDGGLPAAAYTAASPHLSIELASRAGEGAKKTVVTHHSPFTAKEDICAQLAGGAVAAAIGDIYEI